MHAPADGRSTPSRSTSVSESSRCIPAYVPGTSADLRWVDGSKEKGLDFDAMDPMYVVEPGVRYTYRLSEAALASVENSTLPEDVKVYFRHDIVINAQNEGRRACLIGWDLAKADLETAKLARADLSCATLTEANLCRATLTRANCRRAFLTGARLSGAMLTEANLRFVTLTKANLKQANFTKADFLGAKLMESNSGMATFTEVNFRHADLTNADFTFSNLEKANLTDADLTNTTLSDVKFESIILPKMRQSPPPASLGLFARSVLASAALEMLSEGSEDSMEDDDDDDDDDEGEDEQQDDGAVGDDADNAVDMEAARNEISAQWMKSAESLCDSGLEPAKMHSQVSTLLAGVRARLTEDLKDGYKEAQRELRRLMEERVNNAKQSARKEIERRQSSVTAPVRVGQSASVAPAPNRWHLARQKTKSVVMFQQAGKPRRSPEIRAIRAARLKPFETLNTCLGRLDDVKAKIDAAGIPTDHMVQKARRRLRIDHMRRMTEYVAKVSDWRHTAELAWRLAAVPPAVLTLHIEELNYLSERLTKVEEPITVQAWQDSVEGWLALRDLMSKVRGRRAQLLLESIFADDEVIRALSWGEACLRIKAQGEPPAALMLVLKKGLSGHVKANYYEYQQEVKKELERIKRVQDMRAQFLALAGSLVLATFIAVGNFLSYLLGRLVAGRFRAFA